MWTSHWTKNVVRTNWRPLFVVITFRTFVMYYTPYTIYQICMCANFFSYNDYFVSNYSCFHDNKGCIPVYLWWCWRRRRCRSRMHHCYMWFPIRRPVWPVEYCSSYTPCRGASPYATKAYSREQLNELVSTIYELSVFLELLDRERIYTEYSQWSINRANLLQ